MMMRVKNDVVVANGKEIVLIKDDDDDAEGTVRKARK